MDSSLILVDLFITMIEYKYATKTYFFITLLNSAQGCRECFVEKVYGCRGGRASL